MRARAGGPNALLAGAILAQELACGINHDANDAAQAPLRKVAPFTESALPTVHPAGVGKPLGDDSNAQAIESERFGRASAATLALCRACRVLDEVHCPSRWGHDFRPDYRYVSRFIREEAADGPIPPLLCLTATAKPDVREDIVRHFRERLGIELTVFDGGAERSNLDYEVIQTTGGEKFAHIHQVLESQLPSDTSGGAIVYCATRRRSEEVAEFLQLKEVTADHFHAGVPPETKKDVQERFIRGDLRAIAATNAFGMLARTRLTRQEIDACC